MISKLETGYKPPGDLVFDDLGTPGVPDSGSATPGNKDPASASKAARSKSVRSGSISGSGRKSQRGSLLPGLFSGGKVGACISIARCHVAIFDVVSKQYLLVVCEGGGA